jgi:hypothetical protein
MVPAAIRIVNFIERDKVTGCWNWLGCQQRGYGRIGMGRLGQDRGKRLAHRVSYEAFVGPIPDGYTLDHLCKNTMCVNPLHLEPVTMRVNVLRSDSPAAIAARQTHCSSGHPLSGDNVYLYTNTKIGRRKCRACHRWRMRKNKLHEQHEEPAFA